MHQFFELPAVVAQAELQDGRGVLSESPFAHAEEPKRLAEAGMRNHDYQLAFDLLAIRAVVSDAGSVSQLRHEIAADLHVWAAESRLRDDHVVVEMEVAAGGQKASRGVRGADYAAAPAGLFPKVLFHAAIDLGLGKRDLLGVKVNRTRRDDGLCLGVRKIFLYAAGGGKRQDSHGKGG